MLFFWDKFSLNEELTNLDGIIGQQAWGYYCCHTCVCPGLQAIPVQVFMCVQHTLYWPTHLLSSCFISSNFFQLCRVACLFDLFFSLCNLATTCRCKVLPVLSLQFSPGSSLFPPLLISFIFPKYIFLNGACIHWCSWSLTDAVRIERRWTVSFFVSSICSVTVTCTVSLVSPWQFLRSLHPI